MKYLDALDNADQFQFATKTGSMAAGAATYLVFYAQNTSATKFALIQHFAINGVIATTAFAVGQLLYELYIARAFTAENAAPGGTPINIAGPNRLKTSMPKSALAVARISSTATLATPTYSLDTQPVGQLNSHSSAGVDIATPIIGSQFVPNNGVLFSANPAANEVPIVLGANEGIALKITVPATGVWIAGIQMKWAECGINI